MCFTLSLLILTISCDPNGDLINSQSIDDQTEKLIATYSESKSPEEVAQLRTLVDETKAYIWYWRGRNINPTSNDISSFMLDLAIEKGMMEPISDTDKNHIIQALRNVEYVGDPSDHISVLESLGNISNKLADILREFENNISQVSSSEEALALINSTRSTITSLNISQEEKQAFLISLNNAETSIETNLYTGEKGMRGLCEECIWQLDWIQVVISIVVTTVAFILTVITFGLASILWSIISFTVFVGVWVLYCVWVPCPDQEPCPPGQSPFCQGSFTFDPETNQCINRDLPSDATVRDGCIVTPRPPSGLCPPGTTGQGLNCVWECFFPLPEGLGMDEEGNIRFNFECQ